MASLLTKGLSCRSVVFSRFLSTSRSSWAAAAAAGSKEHIDGLVKGKKLVVFMKGTPDAPKCGFSNAIVQILQIHGVDKFDAHNVLDDENIRQGNESGKPYCASSWTGSAQRFLEEALYKCPE